MLKGFPPSSTLFYKVVGSRGFNKKDLAPAAEVAASSFLRRAAALAGLGLELWGVKIDTKKEGW